jgi:hypothetical protein
MTSSRPDAPQRAKVASVLTAAGTALLTGLAIARLPPPHVWLQPPETPFDRSGAWDARGPFLLLRRAASIVPRGASVAVRTQSGDPSADTYLFRDAVGLLPGRRVLPAARWGAPTPELARQAQFLVLLGPLPTTPEGELLLSTPEGTIWRMSR